MNRGWLSDFLCSLIETILDLFFYTEIIHFFNDIENLCDSIPDRDRCQVRRASHSLPRYAPKLFSTRDARNDSSERWVTASLSPIRFSYLEYQYLVERITGSKNQVISSNLNIPRGHPRDAETDSIARFGDVNEDARRHAASLCVVKQTVNYHRLRHGDFSACQVQLWTRFCELLCVDLTPSELYGNFVSARTRGSLSHIA